MIVSLLIEVLRYINIELHCMLFYYLWSIKKRLLFLSHRYNTTTPPPSEDVIWNGDIFTCSIFWCTCMIGLCFCARCLILTSFWNLDNLFLHVFINKNCFQCNTLFPTKPSWFINKIKSLNIYKCVRLNSLN